MSSVTLVYNGKSLPQEYFDVRYEVLRKPLGSPRGSELLNDDDTAIHSYADVDGKIISVGRAQLIAGDGSVKDPVGSNCPAFEPLQKDFKKTLIDAKGTKIEEGLRPAVQIRQMGTLPKYQGQGWAAMVLEKLEKGAVDYWKARTGWLQARIAAITFYEKCGWTAYGEEYDVNKVGPHRSMWKKL